MSGNHERDDPGSAGRDASVARAWREASDEQPPSRIDAAILSAARESVQRTDRDAKASPARPRPRSWWLQWQPLLAAASVAGLALVVVQLLPRDRDVAPALEKPQVAPVAPAAESATAAAADAAVQRAPVARGESDDRALGAVPVLPPTAPEPATAAAGGVARPAAEATEATAAAAARLSQSHRDAESPSAVDRAARIAALYAAGDEIGAAEALREFRAAEPGADRYLPESLREWARTVE